MSTAEPQSGFTPSQRSTEHGFTLPWRSAEHGYTPLWRSAEHGFTPLWRSAEHGFTLIEMLVALAIFGMAALALLKLVGISVQSAGAIDRAFAAQVVAENVLVEGLADPTPPPLGDSQGVESNAGTAWRWTRRVTRAGDDRLTRIDVAVFGPDGRPLASLSTLRTAGAAQ